MSRPRFEHLFCYSLSPLFIFLDVLSAGGGVYELYCFLLSIEMESIEEGLRCGSKNFDFKVR
jgi:hypothetical protein